MRPSGTRDEGLGDLHDQRHRLMLELQPGGAERLDAGGGERLVARVTTRPTCRRSSARSLAAPGWVLGPRASAASSLASVIRLSARPSESACLISGSAASVAKSMTVRAGVVIVRSYLLVMSRRSSAVTR
jgi:hypothetical protein